MRLWGAKPGLKYVWNQMQNGDYVLFYSHNYFIASGEAAFKTVNKGLARKVWGEDEDGQTWDNVFFVTNVKQLNLHRKEFNKTAGYSEDFVPRGFVRVARAFVRMSKNLGTSTLISMYAYILTDDQSNEDDLYRSLDAALRSYIAPQLENVPRWSVETIREFSCGDVTRFLESKKSTDLTFSRYVEEFTKLLKYLGKDEVQRRVNAYTRGQITESGWPSYNPWQTRTRPHLPGFQQSLDGLIKELEIM